jgi:hypothetical protein
MAAISAFLTRSWGSRWHLFEIHDLESCPALIRESVQDNLAFAWRFEDHMLVKNCAAKQAAPILIDALKRAGTDEILDMCSGGGGPFDTLAQLDELKTAVSKFTLTDLYPNLDAFKRLAAKHPGRIGFSEKSVDATACDYGRATQKHYLRTMCASMHHMSEDLLVGILADCVAKNDAFAAIEITSRSVVSIAILPVGSPLLTFIAWFLTFSSMRSWESAFKRFVFTFLIPIIPLVFVFDGFVSCLRTYTPEEFMRLARKADPDNKYEWTVKEQILDGLYVPMISYIGIPKRQQ